MLSGVLITEPTQAPLLREIGPAASPMPPGKALGELLSATDRELRLVIDGGAAAQSSVLARPMQAFLGHLERPEVACELVASCLNHLLDAPPPKKAQHPRAVRLILAAAAGPCTWAPVCAALGDALGRADKRVKLAACTVLRDVLAARIGALSVDPRAVGKGAATLAEQAQAASQLETLLRPLMPLTAALLSVAERDGLIDPSTPQNGPLPTRLTTLAADCCISAYIAFGRLSLLRPTADSAPARSTEASSAARGITVIAAHTSGSDSDGGSEDEQGAEKAAAAAVASGGEGTDVQSRAGRELWQALPDMCQLLRLMRQWYSGRHVRRKLVTLVLGLDCFLTRLAPIEELFRVYRQLGQNQQEETAARKDREQIVQEGGGLLGLLWAMAGPPLLADGAGLVEGLERELEAAEAFLPTNAIALDEDERAHGELPCELALVSVCLLLGRAKRKAMAAVLQAKGAQLQPRLLQVLHTGWLSASRAAASLAGVVLAQLSNDGTVLKMVPSLIAMLDTMDSAAEAVCVMLSQAVFLAPAELERHVLQDVLAAADANAADAAAKARKSNAIKVLELLVGMQQEVLRSGDATEGGLGGEEGESGSAAASQQLMQTLCRVLLARLKDEELSMRCRSSVLLGHGEPRVVLPCLCRLLYANDARTRAAAEKALVAVLRAHRRPLAAAATLLEIIRLPFAHLPCTISPAAAVNPMPVPRHPGEIGPYCLSARSELQASEGGEPRGGKEDEVGAARDWPSRVVRLLPKWLEALPTEQGVLREHVASLVVRRVFAAPQDTVLVQVCSAVSAFLAVERRVVLRLVAQRMEALGESEKRVLVECHGGVAADDSTQSELLFARLSPLLVLKLLPVSAFDDDDVRVTEAQAQSGGGQVQSSATGEATKDDDVPGILDEVLKHVQARLFRGGEFKQVREVAAEVFGRLSPRRTAPLLTRALACVEAGGGPGASGKVEAVDDDAARTAILVLCHAFACHGVVAEFSKLSLTLQRLLVGSCCPVRTSSANDGGGASDSQGSDAAGTQDTSAQQGAGGSSAGDTTPASGQGHLQDGCVAALSAAIAGQMTKTSAAVRATCPVLGPHGILDVMCGILRGEDVSVLLDDSAGGKSIKREDGAGQCLQARAEVGMTNDSRAQGAAAALERRACHVLAVSARSLPPARYMHL